VLRRIAPLFAVVLAALAASGCGGGPSEEEFASQVRDSRDRTDAALQNITTAEDWDQLLLRIRAASDQIGSAAEDLDEVGAPDEYEDEARELVTSLRGLSEEVGNTATALEEEPTFQDQPVSALEFAFWDRTQEALASLRTLGIDVPELGRHAPAQPSS
jgi:outer membrane murein-binding lipoprotein Lpp